MKKVLKSFRDKKAQKSGGSPRNSTTNRTSISDVALDDDPKNAAETIELKPLRQPITVGTHNAPFSAKLNPVIAMQSNDYEYRYLLQNYTPQKKSDSFPVSINHMDDYFKISTEMSELLIYLPICIHEDIYSQPDQLRDFLKAVVTAFKPRPVHIVLTISDELNRHQIYKEKFMHDEFFKPMRNTSSLHLDKSDDCRNDAKKLGDDLIESLALENIAQEIGCKITHFRWGELTHPEMTSATLRTCFLERMRISDKTTEVSSDISITSLSEFVSAQFSSGVGFAAAVQPKLNEVSNNDLSTFTDKTNVNVSIRSNKKYIFEEVAHMMQVYSTGLFDVTIHAHDFKWRKFSRKVGTSLFGEVLHHWTCELLNSYLAEHNKRKLLSEKPAALNLPHYITVGRYPKSRADYIVVKSNKKKKASEASTILGDNNERSLHQIVIEEVETRRGLQTLSSSEILYYEQALVATGRRSSDKTPKADDKKAKKSLGQSKSLATLSTVSKDKERTSSLPQSIRFVTQHKGSGEVKAQSSSTQTKNSDVSPVALDDAIVLASTFQNESLRAGPGFFDNAQVIAPAQVRNKSQPPSVFDRVEVSGAAPHNDKLNTSIQHNKSAGDVTQAMSLRAVQSVPNDKNTPILIPPRKNTSAPPTVPDNSNSQHLLRRTDGMGLPRKVSSDDGVQVFANRRRSFTMLIRVSDDEESLSSSQELLVM
ncbi:MAG: hypothetical protein K2X50_03600 [Gammaproteobacteria bacterium]|nr:hypothetical protein [Gammaproteobacteria bacterium]